MVRLFAQPGQRFRHHHALPLQLAVAISSPGFFFRHREDPSYVKFAGIGERRGLKPLARRAVFPFQNARGLLVREKLLWQNVLRNGIRPLSWGLAKMSGICRNIWRQKIMRFTAALFLAPFLS